VSELETAVERVWPGRGVRFEPLGGGITNHNAKVELDGEVYVLRVAGKDTDLLGIDRKVERDASMAAAALGVGPEVIEFIEPEGWLVTRFIEGEPVPVERMRGPRNLDRVASALGAVHRGPPVSGSFNSFRVVERYLEITLARGGVEPDRYAWAHDIARTIESTREGKDLCFCHNDLLNANFIDDGKRIRIVDWEYAGMGDRFFDLANFAINHELGPEERESLLRAYSGEAQLGDARAALELMRFMSDFREAMWGVVTAPFASSTMGSTRHPPPWEARTSLAAPLRAVRALPQCPCAPAP
jgi:thiamine kinase-like enzyme